MTFRVRDHTGEPISTIQSLEEYFRDGGVSIIQAAFTHTYFVRPDAVREKTPFFPDRVRRSREHYPKLDKGASAKWDGDGRTVVLDDNSRAQMAWEQYTGHKLARRSAYGLRHIWGNTHNPEAFTAGWNICYMPFWAGMLTEDQHPHSELQQAIRQASWDLFFARDTVCPCPDFVEDPGFDLTTVLDGLPVQFMSKEGGDNPRPRPGRSSESTLPVELDPPEKGGVSGCLAADQGSVDRGIVLGRSARGAPLGRGAHEALIQCHWKYQEPPGVPGWRMAAQGYHKSAGEHRGYN